jgi:1-acyl-sn-glycerol-3-phosphate acyltransferase
MSTAFRVAWRLLAVATWLLWGVLLVLLLLRFNTQTGYSPMQIKVLRWWSTRLLSVLGVRLSVYGQVQEAPIWVANHISWLDILVLMSIAPSRFLSKSDVAEWPLIGWFAKRLGTVFIRRGASEVGVATEQLKHWVGLGDRVLFFPEGTSSASAPLKFHARLFSLPVSLGAAIAPVAVMYHDTQVKPRSDLAYIGEQTFVQSLTHLLAQKQLVAQVVLLPSIDAASFNRNGLAEAAHLSISKAWHDMVEQSHNITP